MDIWPIVRSCLKYLNTHYNPLISREVKSVNTTISAPKADEDNMQYVYSLLYALGFIVLFAVIWSMWIKKFLCLHKPKIAAPEDLHLAFSHLKFLLHQLPDSNLGPVSDLTDSAGEQDFYCEENLLEVRRALVKSRELLDKWKFPERDEAATPGDSDAQGSERCKQLMEVDSDSEEFLDRSGVGALNEAISIARNELLRKGGATSGRILNIQIEFNRRIRVEREYET